MTRTEFYIEKLEHLLQEDKNFIPVKKKDDWEISSLQEKQERAAEILRFLQYYEVKCDLDGWHIKLSGGNNSARKHYQRVLKDIELEACLILELAKTDANLYDLIQERRAIRWADGLPDDELSAVTCNM